MVKHRGYPDEKKDKKRSVLQTFELVHTRTLKFCSIKLEKIRQRKRVVAGNINIFWWCITAAKFTGGRYVQCKE